MRKYFLFLLAITLAVLPGCAKNAQTHEVKNAEAAFQRGSAGAVGICLPNDDAYWADSAVYLEDALEELGYGVNLLYAQDDASLQSRQVLELAEKGVDCLVIGAVDSVTLVDAEQTVWDQGIPIVAFDQLLMDTDTVSAAVTFDYTGIGVAIGQYIAEAKDLENAPEGQSYTIEFFSGTLEDNNAYLLHQGILSVLQPYLDSGVLVCATGRTAFEDCYVKLYDPQTAQTQCSAYLTASYPDTLPDILCCASDDLAAGCIKALTAHAPEGAAWPLITGQNGTYVGLNAVEDCLQAMTVWKDTRMLATQCAAMVQALVNDSELPINDTASAKNHVITVPAYVCDSAVVDKNNLSQYRTSGKH